MTDDTMNLQALVGHDPSISGASAPGLPGRSDRRAPGSDFAEHLWVDC
jgi:hypothetical protein